MFKKSYIILLILGVIFVGCSSDSYQIEQEGDSIQEDGIDINREGSSDEFKDKFYVIENGKYLPNFENVPKSIGVFEYYSSRIVNGSLSSENSVIRGAIVYISKENNNVLTLQFTEHLSSSFFEQNTPTLEGISKEKYNGFSVPYLKNTILLVYIPFEYTTFFDKETQESKYDSFDEDVSIYFENNQQSYLIRSFFEEKAAYVAHFLDHRYVSEIIKMYGIYSKNDIIKNLDEQEKRLFEKYSIIPDFNFEKEGPLEVESEKLPDLFINPEILPEGWYVELEDDLFNQILPESNPGFPVSEYSDDLIAVIGSDYMAMGVYSSLNENRNGFVAIHYIGVYSSQKEEIFNKLNEKSQFGDLKNVFNIGNYIIFIQGPNEFIRDLSQVYVSMYQVSDVVIEVEY